MRNLHDILLKHMSVIYQCFFILHGCTFEKETLTQMSYCKFCEISKNNFFNTSGGCFCLKCDWLYNFPSFSCLLLLKISCLFHFNTKMKQEKGNTLMEFKYLLFSRVSICLMSKISPNGHIFVDSPSIQRRNSTWKVRRDFIDFERRIHVEIMTSFRSGNFNVDSIFKTDKISMSFPREFFYAVPKSNRGNYFTCCFLSIILEHFLLWELILS